MTLVYKVISGDNQFAAFWQKNEREMVYYLPSLGSLQLYYPRQMKQWYDARLNYILNEPSLGSYDEIVNAGWHFLAQNNCYIDKSKVDVATVEPGIYYPRIWRGNVVIGDPLSHYNPINPTRVYGQKYIQSAVASSSLFDYLTEIFRNVEPAKANYLVFGHKIRELLILTCTEIESAWRAVLEENTKKENRKTRYNTEDYISVKEPLRLGDWGVVLADYRNLGLFTPFENWDARAPTKSLSWYDAYNAVKHHREVEFGKATFEHLLNAMAALHIMQCAQWGPDIYSRLHDNRSSPFNASQCPAFEAGELYMPSIDGSDSFKAGMYFDNR